MDFGDKNDRMLFEEMYQEYQITLRKLAFRNGIPYDDVEDIVHDTFLSYASAKYSMELPVIEKKKLLGRIIKNKCIDYHRKAKRHECTSIEEEWYTKEDIIPNEKEEPLLNQVIRHEQYDALAKAIENMPKNWHDIAILRLIQGRPTKEICERLNISEKAFYSRVGRIRKYLEKFIKDED